MRRAIGSIRKTGNNYLLTVQYPENIVKNLADLGSMPLRAPHLKQPTRLDSVVHISHILAPTEVDHYQIRRTVDVYVAPTGEDLSRVYAGVQKIIGQTHLPENMTVTVRGSVQAMRESFKSFAIGLVLSVILVYLILVAQFRSFVDPFLILLAVPPGLTGVLLILYLTGTPLNVMSLMGVVMMVGIVGFRQHSDCGIHQPAARRRAGPCARRWRWPAGAVAPGVDDLPGDADRADSDGGEDWAPAAKPTRRWPAPSLAAWPSPPYKRFFSCPLPIS